jgi:hypothetical protein
MMQPLKESTYAGDNLNKYNDYYVLLIGIIGAIITLVGLTQLFAQVFFVIGSSLLLITAIYFRLIYFIALELILLAGHGVILLEISTALQIAVPVLLCGQLLVFYYLSNQLNTLIILIGILGIAFLSIGFAYENQWVFFLGSSAIAFYAFSTATKNKITLVWACLNTLFAIITITKIGLTFYYLP